MDDRRLTLGAEDFEPLLGDAFTFSGVGGQTISTRLEHARGLGGEPAPGAARAPFALLFTTGDRGVLPQQTVRVENQTLGEIEIFVVPVGPNADGRMQYEAIFT